MKGLIMFISFIITILLSQTVYSKSIGNCPPKLRSNLLKNFGPGESVLKSEKCATTYATCVEKRVKEINPLIQDKIKICSKKLKSKPIPKTAHEFGILVSGDSKTNDMMEEILNYVCCLSRVASKKGGIIFNKQLKIAEECLPTTESC